jgi:Activator of Hsp90 ATPase homolog 1-like protein
MTAAIHAFSIPPVVKTVIVECSVQEAFDVFTSQIGRWYPLERFSIAPSVDCRIEARLGGRIYEIGADGQERLWGYVREWNPPHELSISWQARVSADEAQRVDISFRSVATGTEVKLVHAGWENLKVAAREWRDKYDAGWVEVFERRFKDFADRAAAPNMKGK